MATRSKEQRILVVMRKLLAQIVKDTTPGPGMRHPLNEQTIKDIRDCFGLISARERELSEQAGIDNTDRPRYVDEPKTSTVIEFKPPHKSKLSPKPSSNPSPDTGPKTDKDPSNND